MHSALRKFPNKESKNARTTLSTQSSLCFPFSSAILSNNILNKCSLWMQPLKNIEWYAPHKFPNKEIQNARTSYSFTTWLLQLLQSETINQTRIMSMEWLLKVLGSQKDFPRKLWLVKHLSSPDSELLHRRIFRLSIHFLAPFTLLQILCQPC